MNKSFEGWKPIAEAPLDRELELRGNYIPSAFAAMNGSVEFETLGLGRDFIEYGHTNQKPETTGRISQLPAVM